VVPARSSCHGHLLARGNHAAVARKIHLSRVFSFPEPPLSSKGRPEPRTGWLDVSATRRRQLRKGRQRDWHALSLHRGLKRLAPWIVCASTPICQRDAYNNNLNVFLGIWWHQTFY
jgi:hypothetical protein